MIKMNSFIPLLFLELAGEKLSDVHVLSNLIKNY